MKKRYIVLVLLIMMAFVFHCRVFAATFTASATATTLSIGGTATLTVNGFGVAGGPIRVTSSNPSVATVSGLNTTWLENSSATATITAVSAGTTTITVTGTVASLSDSSDESAVTKIITVTVLALAPVQPSNPTPPPVQKSSDATATSIRLNVEGIMFDKNKNDYTMSVPSSVASVTLSVTPATGATYSTSVTSPTGVTNWIWGNNAINLATGGENIIRVYMTAQDGVTKNTYTIRVTRSDDPEKTNAYLESVIFNNARLVEEFNKGQFEYTLEDVENGIQEISLSVFPENTNAQVETTGNKSLDIGENVIKVTVTAEDCITKQEYTFKVNKKEEVIKDHIDDGGDDVKGHEENNKKDDSITESHSLIGGISNINQEEKLLIIVYVFAVVEFVEILYLFIQLDNSNEKRHDEEIDIPKFKKKIRRQTKENENK